MWSGWAGALVALLSAASPSHAREDGSPAPFVVTVHVASATPDDADRRAADFLDIANRHFAAAGISFVASASKLLPASFAVLETAGERRRLKRFFVPRTINVFLLDRIEDPVPSEATKKAAAWQGIELSGLLAGAHIEHKGQTPGTYIILSRHTENLTLTHELGHFFGAGHAKDPGNIMSYGREKHGFDDKQLRCFRTTAARFRKQRVLKHQ